MVAKNKITDTQQALLLFEEAAIKHGEATEHGDYKKGNRKFNLLIASTSFLKAHNAIDQLRIFFHHSSIAVRMSAATFILFKNEKESISILEDISQGSSIHALSAETILAEWKKGNLAL